MSSSNQYSFNITKRALLIILVILNSIIQFFDQQAYIHVQMYVTNI